MIDTTRIFRFQNIEREPTGAVRGEWMVPDDLPYLRGHFPGHPVLPAVAIVDGSLEFLRASGLVVSDVDLVLKRAKFMALILPGMRVRLQAQPKAENRWDIDWSNGDAWPRAKFESMCSLSFVL